MRIVLMSTILCFVLAGCSQVSSRKAAEKLNAYDVAPSAPPADASNGGKGDATAATPLTVTIPKIAYDYTYSFRLPADRVASTQQAHIAACDNLGLTRCQLVSSESSSGNGSAASLKLRVASDVARRFGATLVDSVAKAGGRAVDQSISAEDVSKEISDTSARIRQRELLVQRLTQILQSRTGKVSELVEAERSVAAAQEELDQAKAWLTQLQGRVAMSDVEIDYAAAIAGAPEQGPLGETIGQSWWFFTSALYAILRLAIFLAPWAAVGIGIFLTARSARRRWGAPATDVESLPSDDAPSLA
ncbi:DUF4349 domain-containing protein [Sphingomonas asaccharolytica]|uniref:DUF4349 domain-containing protein n=1 Tax=Sphingomonas asaccharolytica TaxID=40681 RepID=UPI00082C8E2D|nr:DUF4349 domain-containing protein [Sphingomonas asaccharolytica]